ncbi:aspartate kinase [Aureliella helgolandensis]|uniref:aspartate kinase n=1 Tax=Aureliella helgolandensis TaxID=2527968 RepID=A0A518G6X6_9BACT|nr:aspartate kinase [Aureliella helgolandensis]QDV24340.1 Aspartokinase [Aureliella helgolandensis]
MSLVVQKFGGTSVADPEKILSAARKAIRAQQAGKQVVVVVSAMGHNTDLLIDLAGQINEAPPAREMDMLLSTGEQVSVALMAMAVHSLGYKAVSMTGAQMGIQTDSSFTKARIRNISPERIQKLLNDGNIVIAAGFQGIDDDFNITTLGRGGSDTTAVALAAVLHADACEIHTDVDGVYTTDPRQLPEARQMSRIGYDEMLELASLGAGVMHNRSIEFAKKYGVPIHVRSSFSDTRGTLIVSESESPSAPVSGAAMTRDEARITVQGVPDNPGTSYELFKLLADVKITVDMIVQNVGEQNRADISFTVPKEELKRAAETVRFAVTRIGATGFTSDDEVSKISVVGNGMSRQTGVAQKMFRAIADAGINIQMITTSEIKISVLVARASAQAALRAVHQSFELYRKPADAADWSELPTRKSKEADIQSLVADLHAVDMEQLSLSEISLSEDQARITLSGVPDSPGLAAEVFEAVASKGIFVDMIVQSYDGYQGQTGISFTVPRAQYAECSKLFGTLSQKFEVRQVSGSEEIAKLSVSGIGLRSHTGVAIGMFEVLAEAGINVEMINTSELRVNVVVEGAQGERALKCLQAKFAANLI